MANNTDLLSQVKNQYVQELAHPKDIPCVNWNEFLDFNDDNSVSWFDRHYNEVARRYAKAVAEQALRNAADNSKVRRINTEFLTKESLDMFQSGYDVVTVDKSTIIDPKNIPEL